jgi:hypothetical protein
MQPDEVSQRPAKVARVDVGSGSSLEMMDDVETASISTEPIVHAFLSVFKDRVIPPRAHRTIEAALTLTTDTVIPEAYFICQPETMHNRKGRPFGVKFIPFVVKRPVGRGKYVFVRLVNYTDAAISMQPGMVIGSATPFEPLVPNGHDDHGRPICSHPVGVLVQTLQVYRAGRLADVELGEPLPDFDPNESYSHSAHVVDDEIDESQPTPDLTPDQIVESIIDKCGPNLIAETED